VILKSEFFCEIVDMEKSSLAKRSRKLFTLSLPPREYLFPCDGRVFDEFRDDCFVAGDRHQYGFKVRQIAPVIDLFKAGDRHNILNLHEIVVRDLSGDSFGMSRSSTFDFNRAGMAVGNSVKTRTKPRLLAVLDAMASNCRARLTAMNQEK
jgi:hypothetical protein